MLLKSGRQQVLVFGGLKFFDNTIFVTNFSLKYKIMNTF